jgi:hypothetical protein
MQNGVCRTHLNAPWQSELKFCKAPPSYNAEPRTRLSSKTKLSLVKKYKPAYVSLSLGFGEITMTIIPK